MGAKERMSVIDAFISETKRFVMMKSLLGYPREKVSETKLLGYSIPKGALILVDTESVMTDEIVWNEAQKFQPSRFLMEEDQRTSYLEWLEGWVFVFFFSLNLIVYIFKKTFIIVKQFSKHRSPGLITLKKKAFENILEKEENAGKPAFSPLSRLFFTITET